MRWSYRGCSSERFRRCNGVSRAAVGPSSGIRFLRTPRLLRVSYLDQARRRTTASAGEGYTVDSSNWLYEPRWGLPIVREKVEYSELLRDIRLERVKEIRWYQGDPNAPDFRGPCLVVYRSGAVKQSWVDYDDMRIPYAMQTHNVKGGMLEPVPDYEMLYPAKPVSTTIMEVATKTVPLLLLVGVWLAAQYAAVLKGDFEDRKTMREADANAKRQARLQEIREEGMVELWKMAEQGCDREQLLMEARRTKLQLADDDIEDILATVAEAKRLGKSVLDLQGFGSDSERDGAGEAAAEATEAAEEEAGAGGEAAMDMEEATAMLRMKTVKVRNAKLTAFNRRRMKGKMATFNREVYFDDVAGIDDAKRELQEVVDFFRNPERFRKSGAQIPRGVLLCGPPGTGKTLLARAVAGESGAAFLSVNASEFVEMFIGVGAGRVRDLFGMARQTKPAIIFIDELDAVGRVRGGAMGNDEREQTLNQMLSELDGFNAETGVIVMAATNRKDVLDPALIRPGRFDRTIFVGLPDFDGRIEVLKVHLKGREHSLSEGDLRRISFQTRRFSGARLANLVNTAALFCGRGGRDVIAMRDMEDALQYEQVGHRQSVYGDDRDRRIAVQEAATALVATLMPAVERVEKVTILPSDKYPLGQTVLDVNDQREIMSMYTRRYLEEQLLMVLAAYAAETLFYSDLERSSINQRRLIMARRIAQKMVVASGMSEHPLLRSRTLTVPLRGGGRALKQLVLPRTSQGSLAVADAQMETLLADALQRTCELLQRNDAALQRLVEELQQQQQLSGNQVREIVEELGHPDDLERRQRDRAGFL